MNNVDRLRENLVMLRKERGAPVLRCLCCGVRIEADTNRFRECAACYEWRLRFRAAVVLGLMALTTLFFVIR